MGTITFSTLEIALGARRLDREYQRPHDRVKRDDREGFLL
jgi:hypothetical protein